MAIDRAEKDADAPLFLGIEHTGICPLKTDADTIATWYEKTFGLIKTEEALSYFVSGPGNGRLEIMKPVPGMTGMHVAIHVSDFEKAMNVLKAKGIRFREPRIQPDLKIVYLEDLDPEGNTVHLWWQRNDSKL